jgi:lysophospholipid acyltransferase (LPLAT)-like uncharacterized protein
MGRRLLARLIAWAVRALGATWRFQVLGSDPYASGEVRLGALWHSDAVIAAWHYRDRGVLVPVSLSRDGELFEMALGHMGFAPSARGSTSRGAMSLLRQLIRAVSRGTTVAVLPDGPRGPAGHVQPGIIAVAGASGLPVVPVAFGARPCWRLGSWDRTRVPPPFARVVCRYGEPLAVPKRADESEREKARAELQRRLDDLRDEVAASLGNGVAAESRRAE